MENDPRLPLWIALAAGYSGVFTIIWLFVIFCGVTALRNQHLIIFRSLGKTYISVLMWLATLLHGANVIAVVMLCVVNIEARIIEVNGALTGLRMWLIAMVFSALISRQFMLAKIFGTLSKSSWAAYNFSRFQGLWPILTISSLLWLPMMVFFFLANYFIITTDIFVGLYSTYYLAYIGVFAFLAVKNRKISRVFSDSLLNVVVGTLLVILVFLGVADALLFQVIFLDTWVFEMSVSYIFGFGFSITSAAVLGRPCLIYLFHKDHLQQWEEFNRKNAFLYGGVVSHSKDPEKQRGSQNGKKEVSLKETSQHSHSSQVRDDNNAPSEMLSASGIVDELTIPSR